jgi:hypothetical protein
MLFDEKNNESGTKHAQDRISTIKFLLDGILGIMHDQLQPKANQEVT